MMVFVTSWPGPGPLWQCFGEQITSLVLPFA
jgi:hypothetical protein